MLSFYFSWIFMMISLCGRSKYFVSHYFCLSLIKRPRLKCAIWLWANIPRWFMGGDSLLPPTLLTLTSPLRMVWLMMMLRIYMKRVSVVRERLVWSQVMLQKKHNSWMRHIRLWMLIIFCCLCWPTPFLTQVFK